MKKMLAVVIIGLFFLMGCFKNESKFEVSVQNKDTLIVFFNIGEYSRAELAESIEKVSKLGPKLLAIETIFDPFNKNRGDSLLAQSLSHLDNVIFAADLDSSDLSIGKTNAFFKNVPYKEGLVAYIVREDSKTIEYTPLFQNHEQQILGFPHEIAFSFRPETMAMFMSLGVNRPVSISYVKTLEDFHILDKENLHPDLIHDKIVIFGYVGPDDYDTYYLTYNETKIRTYSAVITANIILKILSEHKGNVRDKE